MWVKKRGKNGIALEAYKRKDLFRYGRWNYPDCIYEAYKRCEIVTYRGQVGITSPAGGMQVRPQDWIICEDGKLYLCMADIFELIYERV